MRILGIDYGEKKIGISFATTMLAEAHSVIRYERVEEAIAKIKKLVQDEHIEKVVIGISEGETAQKTKRFAYELKSALGKPIIFQDETLSTQTAQKLAIEANVSRKKRRRLEDAFTAALILQDYLDTHK